MVRICLLLILLPSSLFASEWENKAAPSKGKPEAIGSYANGCLVGAQALPIEGNGYQILRPQRARYFAHPSTIQFIQDLAQQSRWLLNRDILIGDLSLPQGGRFSSGHSSHQTGLDADIWFKLSDTPLSSEQLASPTPYSLVDRRQFSVRDKQWQSGHFALLKLSASDPRVARIFVHPAIKAKLCEIEKQDRSWLRKVRPWWGHHYHMHVRLSCHVNDDNCINQPPPPPGDGCGKELASWWPKVSDSVLDQKKKGGSNSSQKSAPKKTKTLPKGCMDLLDG